MSAASQIPASPGVAVLDGVARGKALAIQHLAFGILIAREAGLDGGTIDRALDRAGLPGAPGVVASAKSAGRLALDGRSPRKAFAPAPGKPERPLDRVQLERREKVAQLVFDHGLSAHEAAERLGASRQVVVKDLHAIGAKHDAHGWRRG